MGTTRLTMRLRGRIVGLLAILLLGLLPGAATASPAPNGICFGSDEELADFVDIRRVDDINIGADLGDGGDEAMNFTGSTGSAGDLWMSIYGGGGAYGNVTLCADVLTHPFNNRKGAGVFMLRSGFTRKSLAVIATNAGNTDLLYLGVADDSNGSFVPLSTVSLGAGIAENAWYRVWASVFVSGGNVIVNARVFRHTDSTDPYSALGTQVGTNLSFSGSLPDGIASSGDIGLLGYAKSAVIDSSAIRFNCSDCSGAG